MPLGTSYCRVRPQHGHGPWTFRSINPATGALPNGAFDGLLSVEDGTGREHGFVTFTTNLKAGTASGAVISEQASIVFDNNEAILTNGYVNTVDGDAPTSSVSPLAATMTTPTFSVAWSGSDGAGSGVESFEYTCRSMAEPSLRG